MGQVTKPIRENIASSRSQYEKIFASRGNWEWLYCDSSRGIGWNIAWALGKSLGPKRYFILYPSSRHNTVTSLCLKVPTFEKSLKTFEYQGSRVQTPETPNPKRCWAVRGCVTQGNWARNVWATYCPSLVNPRGMAKKKTTSCVAVYQEILYFPRHEIWYFRPTLQRDSTKLLDPIFSLPPHPAGLCTPG